MQIPLAPFRTQQLHAPEWGSRICSCSRSAADESTLQRVHVDAARIQMPCGIDHRTQQLLRHRHCSLPAAARLRPGNASLSAGRGIRTCLMT
ncbi:hypothetical protein ANCCAN_24543 [Ancylostoma caninum]|uniref:Uncharacterized protein n=1 Tax=Ancylostoma caninum TaxID=29170 RepID=A0A368FFP4_ANCCA|nr:hypothetical protein ANCCAN_24543 [Ancylostoma caninum]